MTINSRQKGAVYERQIAKELFLLTGVSFKRQLNQYREADRDDLEADDPAWPFSCELKRRGSGVTCLPAWKEQAQRSAAAVGKMPCVIFRFDRQDTRVALPLSALCPALPAGEWVEMTLEGFAALAAEKMAGARHVG